MESVALHAAAADLARQRNELRHRRLTAMEAGIETGNLWHAWQPLGDGIDGVKVVRLMKRCERHQGAQILHDLRRDDSRLRVLRAAVNDAVANAEHAGAMAVPRAKPAGERIERSASIDARFELFVSKASAAAIAGREARRRSDAVDLTTRFHRPGGRIRVAEDREFEAR